MPFYRDRVFPWLLARLSGHFDEDRKTVLAHARGRVLEVGVGTGANLGFYPDAVDEVVGIDPNPGVLERARAALEEIEARDQGLPYRVLIEEGDAAALPHDDDSFDTAVAFLTLCSVPEPHTVARELRRVLRPGGRLLVMEHVRAHPGSRLARWQQRLDPLWTRAAAGCHIHRETASILRDAGFDTAPLESYREGLISLTAPRIRGVIRAAPAAPLEG